MKKNVRYITLSLALISACFTFVGCNEDPIDVTMAQIYEANQTTTLLQTFDKIGVVATDRNEVKTETYLDGVIYYEAVTANDVIIRECYNKAGTIGYQKDETNTYFALLAMEDRLKAKPTKAYESQIFDDEAVALQEEILSATRKGDAIQVKTRLSADTSALVFTADGYAYENGEYVEAEYLLEKDTNRVLTAKRITVKIDGATTLYENVEQKTAISPDGEIASLRARVQAVEGNANLRQMTVEMDPNTINEKLCSAFAMIGDRFKVELGQYYTQFYTDVQCQEPYQFKESDTRKAFIKLYTKKVFVPEEYTFTMQDIINANSVQARLQNCDAITVQMHTIEKEKTTLHFDRNSAYIKTEDLVEESVDETVVMKDNCLCYHKTGDTYSAGIVNNESVLALYGKLADVFSVEEVIQYAETNAGKLIVTTKYEEAGVTDKYWIYEYVLDARTYCIEKRETYVGYPDGTRSMIGIMEIKEDVEKPTGMAELLARTNDTENVREVVIVTNPGTSDIAVIRVSIAKGDKFYMADYKLHTDFACTQAFEDVAPYEEDLLLYATPYSA